MRRGSIASLVGIGVVAGGIAAAIALALPWLPTPASREAGRIGLIPSAISHLQRSSVHFVGPNPNTVVGAEQQRGGFRDGSRVMPSHAAIG